jgi:hypothetical protein
LLPDNHGHFAVGKRVFAQVATRQPGVKPPQLHRQRLVEAQPPGKLGLHLRRRLGAQHHRGRVTGHQVDHAEQQADREEQD